MRIDEISMTLGHARGIVISAQELRMVLAFLTLLVVAFAAVRLGTPVAEPTQPQATEASPAP